MPTDEGVRQGERQFLAFRLKIRSGRCLERKTGPGSYLVIFHLNRGSGAAELLFMADFEEAHLFGLGRQDGPNAGLVVQPEQRIE